MSTALRRRAVQGSGILMLVQMGTQTDPAPAHRALTARDTTQVAGALFSSTEHSAPARPANTAPRKYRVGGPPGHAPCRYLVS